MNKMLVGLVAVVTLGGCGIKEIIQRSDDQYMVRGALDMPLSSYYNTYSFKFMDKYRVTHEAPVGGGCRYHGGPGIPKGASYEGVTYNIRDIFEEDGKVWQRSVSDQSVFSIDEFFHSIKSMQPVYEFVNGVNRKTDRKEEIEVGLRALCFYSWEGTGHVLGIRLYKRDLATWRALLSAANPQGKWSMQQIGGNNWWLLANDEETLGAQKPGGIGGGFVSWLLPVGDTGYTLTIQLGANKKSLENPKAHEQMKATLRHMVESVKIEALP
ncbi:MULTISPECIES: hypothetical protein [unclassified Duganella]|uniref:hypothetical protein n=1 Tax=unclassified Duganella TaxID=2636909 RepID=UPI0011C0D757|nr:MULTISPECIES: hypothetical protein [unclassified Duganella]